MPSWAGEGRPNRARMWKPCPPPEGTRACTLPRPACRRGPGDLQQSRSCFLRTLPSPTHRPRGSEGWKESGSAPHSLTLLARKLRPAESANGGRAFPSEPKPRPGGRCLHTFSTPLRRRAGDTVSLFCAFLLPICFLQPDCKPTKTDFCQCCPLPHLQSQKVPDILRPLKIWC